MLKFHVGAFLHKPEGAKEKFEINEALHFQDPADPKLLAPVIAQVEFLKLPHEINVHLKDVKTVARAQCSRCLSIFECPIHVPSASREFIIDLPERELADKEEVSYVNKATNEIDLSDMVREEIILHFPTISLCSASCKGLCDRCGTNLNEKICSCVHAQAPMNRIKIT